MSGAGGRWAVVDAVADAMRADGWRVIVEDVPERLSDWAGGHSVIHARMEDERGVRSVRVYPNALYGPAWRVDVGGCDMVATHRDVSALVERVNAERGR